MPSPATAAPVITFNSATSPYGALSSLAFPGSGPSGAILAGTTSTPVAFRIYNNSAAAVNILDAINGVLAVYDDAVNQGNAAGTIASQQWCQVQVVDYAVNNGTPSTTSGDTSYFPVGGSVKHAIPVNTGTLAGSGSNVGTNFSSIDVSAQLVVPLSASSASVSWGLWLEYSYI